MRSPAGSEEKFRLRLKLLLSALILCRALLLLWAPHTDPSESRYAEISRKMVETGNWVTPQFDYGVPFWAKPPLSMWMSALGIKWFGANEFGSRIFIFIAALGILVVVARAVRREIDATSGLVAATLLMGMPLFFYCSAAVMTDLALVFGTTLAMLAFRTAVLENSRRWGYVFFIGLAIGLLAKGPLVLVLAFPPIVGWILLTGQWRRAWKCLPRISGTLLMMALSLPWYIIAERKTPGFINYFIVGEHWKRFFINGWEGDLYGSAHAKLPGTIWVYLLMMTFPWCLGLLAIPFRRWREARSWAMASDGRGLYWLLWALWTIVFFTPSRNIIVTYPLPALPALAILMAGIFKQGAQAGFTWKRFNLLHPALVMTCFGMIFLAGTLSLAFPDLQPDTTDKGLVRFFQSHRGPQDRLIYFGTRRFSAEFYTSGETKNTESLQTLTEDLDSPGLLYVAMIARSWVELPAAVQSRLSPLTHRGHRLTDLYMESDKTRKDGVDPHKMSLNNTGEKP